MRIFVLLFCSILLVGGLARATSVIPPTFAELVDGSPLIFRGEVKTVHSELTGAGERRHIATLVTFVVEHVIKGSAGGELTLEFMGGQSGGRRLEVCGLPQFAPGERGVFFVENVNGHLCPLMRLRHGRYRIVDGGSPAAAQVRRDNGSPLHATAEVQQAMGERVPASTSMTEAGMSLANFEAAIAAQMASAASPDASAR